jgi:hypothetical protein
MNPNMSKRNQTAFEKGRKDCLANVAMSKNPYRGNRREIWQAGWDSIIKEKIDDVKWNSKDMSEQQSVQYLMDISEAFRIPKEFLAGKRAI